MARSKKPGGLTGWAIGAAVGITAPATYLLAGGSDLLPPDWAVIAFYPGFVAGYQVFRLGYSELIGQTVGCITVSASYAIIAAILCRLISLLRR